MGAGASVWQGNRRSLAVLFNARVGLLIIDGRTALAARIAGIDGRSGAPSTDTDMETEIDDDCVPNFDTESVQ